MSLITPTQARAQIKTALSDTDLQAIIDREDAAMVRLIGAHYTGVTQTITETLSGGMRNIYLRRRFTSVSSITEDGSTLTSDDWREWPDEGRIERLEEGKLWGDVLLVVYKPADDNDEREAVLVELVRLAIEHTAMASENIAGEYSFSAPDWDLKRSELLARLTFPEV